MEARLLESKQFLSYACLPFVQLHDEKGVEFGPVIFWPASLSIDKEIEDYLKEICQVKTTVEGSSESIITQKLDPKKIICISIDEKVPRELREFLLIDSIYLLYFSCIFKNLYYGLEIPSFNPLRKMVPISREYINTRSNWEKEAITASDCEQVISLQVIDPEICNGLGKALHAIYVQEPENKDMVFTYKRILRSIRYLVDRFFQRFMNLFDKGLHFSDDMFEPEDLIFLASSFEALFNLENTQSAADFKHQLRPLLHLKYSRPVEIFWKWVDDFYDLKRKILNGDHFFDPQFKLNPNFTISHLLLGIKLFVYSVYYFLFKYDLLKSTKVDPFTPPDFKWIHPEEILLFFWTELAVLEKVSLWIKESQQEELNAESLADLNLLTTLFVSLYDRYYLSEQNKGEGSVQFIPTPIDELKNEVNAVLEGLEQIKSKVPNSNFLKSLHPYFADVLADRLNEKKLG